MHVDWLRTAAEEVKAAMMTASTSLAVTQIEGDLQALFHAGASFYCKIPGHMKAQCPIITAKNAFRTTAHPFAPQPRPFARQAYVNTDLPSYVPPSVISSSPPLSVVLDDRLSQVSLGSFVSCE